MRVVVAAATTTHITADEAPGTAGSRRDARDSSWCWEAPMAVTQTRESSSPAPRGPFTYKHLQHLRDRLDERYRCEIINGKLFVSPSPGRGYSARPLARKPRTRPQARHGASRSARRDLQQGRRRGAGPALSDERT